jgi:hypothetical protein
VAAGCRISVPVIFLERWSGSRGCGSGLWSRAVAGFVTILGASPMVFTKITASEQPWSSHGFQTAPERTLGVLGLAEDAQVGTGAPPGT